MLDPLSRGNLKNPALIKKNRIFLVIHGMLLVIATIVIVVKLLNLLGGINCLFITGCFMNNSSV
jgi:hypothetical protein